jgi:hypothetical protein
MVSTTAPRRQASAGRGTPAEKGPLPHRPTPNLSHGHSFGSRCCFTISDVKRIFTGAPHSDLDSDLGTGSENGLTPAPPNSIGAFPSPIEAPATPVSAP